MTIVTIAMTITQTMSMIMIKIMTITLMIMERMRWNMMNMAMTMNRVNMRSMDLVEKDNIKARKARVKQNPSRTGHAVQCQIGPVQSHV